ncbi:MAG TPA: hypothetical protein VIX73_00570 [Kofleriaceae bacterium]|jgi:hypothetical protein
MKPDKPTHDENHGEGDRRSAHRGPQPTKVTLDELMAKGRTVADRVESMVRRIADRLRRSG